jgi:3-methyl-2-oxobutanoate hydroxymethyltransferase
MADRITVDTLRERKRNRRPVTGLTAYDYPTAVLVDRAELDLVLVGDSLGQMILGYRHAEETTMDDMIHHCRAVSRGATRAMVIGDMPFGSYEIAPETALHNAIRLVKEGGVSAVKVEGGTDVAPAVRAMSRVGIPVFGHLAPIHAGSPNGEESAEVPLVGAATALEEAGAAAVVLVGLEAKIAGRITAALRHIPSIGYRSGPHCDGQLLVTPYMIGLMPPEDPQPGPYAALGHQLLETFMRFRADVVSGSRGESE